jgi:hypothetical protein
LSILSLPCNARQLDDFCAQTWDQRATSPTHTRSFLKAYEKAHQQRILCFSVGGERAIAPFVHMRGRLANRFVMLQNNNEPVTPLIGTADAAHDLVEALPNFELVFRRMPADCPLIDALTRRYWVRRFSVDSCPFIRIDESWKEPEAHFNAGRRSDFRRWRRKAEKSGPISVEIIAPNPEQLSSLVGRAIDIEAASWKTPAGTAIAVDATRGTFYRAFTSFASASGFLRLCFLRIGEQYAAMQIATIVGDGFWLHKIGYDARFAKASPGQLLMLETLRYAAAQGLKTYEFLGTAELWTRLWTPTSRNMLMLRAYPKRIGGALFLGKDLLRNPQTPMGNRNQQPIVRLHPPLPLA